MVFLWQLIYKKIVLKSFEQIYKYIQKASGLNHIHLFLLPLSFHDQIFSMVRSALESHSMTL